MIFLQIKIKVNLTEGIFIQEKKLRYEILFPFLSFFAILLPIGISSVDFTFVKSKFRRRLNAAFFIEKPTGVNYIQ
jgi:hypothetical protein